MSTKKRSAEDARRLLKSRRDRLGRLLALDAPDIILAAEMRLVSRSQREVHGRGWDRTPPLRAFRNWLWFRVFTLRMNLRAPLRCECGHLIWGWQARGYDPDLEKTIHLSCGTLAEVQS